MCKKRQDEAELQIRRSHSLQVQRLTMIVCFELACNSDLFWNHVVECSVVSFIHKDYRS